MPDGAVLFSATSVASQTTPVTGPAAGAVIASVTPLPGLWDVEMWISISGTAAVATDSNNMQAKFGSTVIIKQFPYAATTAGTTNGPGPYKMRVLCDGVTAITINAVANATATAVYAGLVTCNRASYGG